MSKTVMTMLVCVVGMVLGAGEPGWAAPVGTAITYQGRLTDHGNPANNQAYDFIFRLYDTPAGMNLLGTDTATNVTPQDGYFKAELDFGSGAFAGDARWLEIDVRQTGTVIYTTLSPRQELTPAPYALYALNGPGSSGFWAASVNDIYNSNSGNVGIGTPSPTGRLHVSTAAIYSDILFVDAGSGQDDLSVDPGSAYTDIIDRLYVVEVTDASDNPDKFKWSDDGGVTWSAELAMTTIWYDLNHGVRIRWSNTDGHDDGGVSTGDVWAWVAVSSNENALVVKEGKLVGIGTATPIWELEVANLAAGGGSESGVAADDARGAIAAYSSTLPAPFDHYGGRVSLFSDGATMGLDLRADSGGGDMRFYTGGPWPANERMRITDTGNVGIGTTTPDSLYVVDVAGSIKASSGTGGLDAYSSMSGGIILPWFSAVYGSATTMHTFGYLGGIYGAYGMDQDSGNYGYLGGDEFGVYGAGGLGGGYFADSDDSGYARVGYGDYGISGVGSIAGGHFADTTDWGYASVGYGNIGIVAYGPQMGGGFEDTDSDGWARVGHSTYKVFGDGAVSFVQNHPDDADKVIVYACPEGDEVATYTRGTARLVNGKAVVPLGETFKWVTNPDIGLTAHLTPRNYAVPLAVVALTTEQLVVRGPEGGPDDVVFDYIVYGLRIGFEEVSIVQEKQREAYIPSMADHRNLYEKRSDLRQYNALERFGAMRAAFGESGALDLTASHTLRDAIIEFDPSVHELPGGGPPSPDDPFPTGERDDSGPAVDPDTVDEPIRPSAPVGTPTSAVGRFHETLGQKDGEIEALRARLDALETLVSELRNTEDGGA
jgi:hypothetical protein